MLYESQYYGVCDLGSESLYHHGIKGQKWGVRNGPPYPLSEKEHRAVIAGTDKKKKQPKYDPNDPNHDRSSVKRQVARLGINTALAVITLNPAYAVDSVSQIAGVISSAHRTKKVNKELSKNENVDKKTGLKLKQKEMTEKEDAARVNPGFKNFNDNTKNNCMLCTATYEMRRRGYDVTANKASYGYDETSVKRWFPKAEINRVMYEPSRLAIATGNNRALVAATKQELLKQGNGARGNLMVTWARTMSGHSMVYEVNNDKVIIRCTQSNKTFSPEKILKKCGTATYARLDNVDFDKKKIKEVCHS